MAGVGRVAAVRETLDEGLSMTTDDEGTLPQATDPPAKRAYLKPQTSRVPLRPEEAVLGACKSLGLGGPASEDCMVTMCASLGS